MTLPERKPVYALSPDNAELLKIIQHPHFPKFREWAGTLWTSSRSSR